jgi:hypothetical protein
MTELKGSGMFSFLEKKNLSNMFTSLKWKKLYKHENDVIFQYFNIDDEKKKKLTNYLLNENIDINENTIYEYTIYKYEKTNTKTNIIFIRYLFETKNKEIEEKIFVFYKKPNEEEYKHDTHINSINSTDASDIIQNNDEEDISEIKKNIDAKDINNLTKIIENALKYIHDVEEYSIKRNTILKIFIRKILNMEIQRGGKKSSTKKRSAKKSSAKKRSAKKSSTKKK